MNKNNRKNTKPNLVVIKNNEPKKTKKAEPKKNNKKQNNRKQNNKKQNNKKSKNSTRSRLKFINFKNFILCIAALIIIALIIYFITGKNIVHIGEEQNLFTTEFGVNSKADFYIEGENIFYCTKDTAALLNKKGENVWSDTFSMVSPAMIADGKFVGIADIKNKILNVYGLTGKVYSIEADGNITSFAINSLGASAVIARDTNDGDYFVSVYNSAGEKMFMGSYVSSDGIPMTVDINDDSSKVAVGFINTTGINVTSNVLFYSTDKAEAASIENSDAMFSAVNCDKEIAAAVKFLNNDSCIIATDKSLMNIGGKDVAQYEQNWRIEFANYVTALDVIDSDYVAVAYGEALEDNENSVEKNTVCWYKTSNGNIKGSTLMENSVSSLSSGLGCTIAELNDNTFVALKPSGKELWSYEGIQNISNILFYGDTDTIAVVSATKMTLTDVKNGASNTEVENTTENEPQTEYNTQQQNEEPQETTLQTTTAVQAAENTN